MTPPGLSCSTATDHQVTEQQPAPRYSCGGCDSLKLVDIDGMGFFFGCAKTECVIPHHLHRDNPSESWEVIFWRIPLECPLPDSEVVKSADRAPQKHWTRERIELTHIEG